MGGRSLVEAVCLGVVDGLVVVREEAKKECMEGTTERERDTVVCRMLQITTRVRLGPFWLGGSSRGPC